MRLSLVVLAAVVVGCGSPGMPDAGPDTSCGLDCAAQARYGLIIGRCFEYDLEGQPMSLPDVGAEVLGDRDGGVFFLEGGVPSLQVEYKRSGMRLMRDSFGIRGGALYLLRRELLAGAPQSWTYRDDAGVIVGVRWVAPEVGPNQTVLNNVVARVSPAGTEVPTSYTVATAAPSASDLDVPAGPFDGGLRMSFNVTPGGQAADGRRVLVPGVGFSIISSAFAASGDNLPRRLRKVRDPGTPDGGTDDCSLGVP